jgi:threonyl-tRNA synthetase
MIHITLPDGSRKPFEDFPTGLAVAKSISDGLARDCVAMEVNGNLMDLDRPIKADAAIRLITTLKSCAIAPRMSWPRRC